MKKTPVRRFLVTALVALLAAFAFGLLPRVTRAEASADLSAVERSEAEIDELVDRMNALGSELGLSIHTMHEDIFNSMHRI